MTNNQQLPKNAQTFISKFALCNAACQDVQDQLMKVQMIQLLVQKFKELFMKFNVQEKKRIEQRAEYQGELDPKVFQSIQDIGAHLHNTTKADMKGVIHRNLKTENLDREMEQAVTLDNNKFNSK